MSDDEDFKNQIKQEKIAQEKEKSNKPTYTDEDGTLFEWDSSKKAYFPKIDEDFIANYQMNYGVPETQNKDSENDKTESTESAKGSEYSWEDYCRYYQYYYGTLPPEAEQYSQYDMSEYFEPDQQIEESQNTTDKSHQPTEDKIQHENKVTEDASVGDKRKNPDGWFDVDKGKNTNVYVSGLPPNITDEEFEEMMSKYGLVMYDPFTKKPKLKLYKDENGEVKGDGRCCYIRNESVLLCIQILDGSNINGHTVHVERAQFQQKGHYDPSKRKKMSNKMKKKLRVQQQKLFDWNPDKASAQRQKHERIVIVKNLFDLKQFENPVAINKLRDDIRSECSNHGDVRKVVVHDRHPDGVATIIFNDAVMAESCVQAINNRIFAGRIISATIWDGQTKFDVMETQEENEKRLKSWDDYLNQADTPSTSSTKITTDITSKTVSQALASTGSETTTDNMAEASRAPQTDDGKEKVDVTSGT